PRQAPVEENYIGGQGRPQRREHLIAAAKALDSEAMIGKFRRQRLPVVEVVFHKQDLDRLGLFGGVTTATGRLHAPLPRSYQRNPERGGTSQTGYAHGATFIPCDAVANLWRPSSPKSTEANPETRFEPLMGSYRPTERSASKPFDPASNV